MNKDRIRVQVLRNKYQSFFLRMGPEKTHMIHGPHALGPAVFNRVGWYKTPDDCWEEYRCSDGSFVSLRTVPPAGLRKQFESAMDDLSDDVLSRTEAAFLNKLRARGVKVGKHIQDMLTRRYYADMKARTHMTATTMKNRLLEKIREKKSQSAAE